MGLKSTITDISNNSDTITIVGGLFTQRVSEGTPHAVSRRLTKGKNEGTEVWEVHYPALSGMLLSAKVTKSNFGGQDGTITLKDFKTDDIFSIQTGAENKKFTDFLKYLPNIDASKELVLEMHPKKNGKLDSNGNPVTDLKVIQGGRVVQNYYTEWKKDESGKSIARCINGMPEWKKTPKGWNHDAQDIWLWERCRDYFESYVSPKFDPDFGIDADGIKETPPEEPEPMPTGHQSDEGFEDSDVPF